MVQMPRFKLNEKQIGYLRRAFATQDGKVVEVDPLIRAVELALQILHAKDRSQPLRARPIVNRAALRRELEDLRRKLADAGRDPDIARAISHSHAVARVTSLRLELALTDSVRRNGRPIDAGMTDCLTRLCAIFEQVRPIRRSDFTRAQLIEILRWVRPQASCHTIDRALRHWMPGRLPDEDDLGSFYHR